VGNIKISEIEESVQRTLDLSHTIWTRFGETQKDSRVCEIASQKVGLSPYVLYLFAFQVTTNSITFKYHVFL